MSFVWSSHEREQAGMGDFLRDFSRLPQMESLLAG